MHCARWKYTIVIVSARDLRIVYTGSQLLVMPQFVSFETAQVPCHSHPLSLSVGSGATRWRQKECTMEAEWSIYTVGRWNVLEKLRNSPNSFQEWSCKELKYWRYELILLFVRSYSSGRRARYNYIYKAELVGYNTRMTDDTMVSTVKQFLGAVGSKLAANLNMTKVYDSGKFLILLQYPFPG